jgi:leucyl aminopeptidase (aminopeptidase T)
VPSIGADFEEIFRETIKINTLDYSLYQRMQQKLIDVLDTADYVEVTGKAPNRTDMKVCLASLSDPSTQTKFENCVADVNIPVGEVFTSPRLTGTNGTLNVGSVYIGEIQFKNLTMEFQDGRVVLAACDNFTENLPKSCSEEERREAEEAGRKLIIQGIMNNHENLPLGEFAIGTNTTAYAMAERFGILDRLPILIVEKMGPHFAVGDTCYSWSEDSPMYNPDGKEMIARDNEISILRREDVSQAYFGVHTDITIPYKELESIRAVHADGTKTTIIEDGRFVLPGLEELNKALEIDT